jgi:MFS family permease
MQTIAQSWLVLELTGSGTALGTVIAVQFLPTLLLSPLGGMLADRLNKRRLLISCQALASILALLLGVLTVTGSVELWMVFLIVGASGIVTAIENPTRQTFVIEMVGPADISNAVVLNSIVINGARVVGPAIGGLVIVGLGTGICFVLNSVSYVAVIGALLFIRREDLFPAIRVDRAPGQLRDGFRYAWHNRSLRTTLIMLSVVGILTIEFPTTLPMFSEFTFGAGAGGLAMMTALMGLGAMVGGLFVASWGDPTPKRLVVVYGLFGFMTCAVSLMPTIGLVYLLMPALGAASLAVITLSNTTLQLDSDPQYRGRVMALFTMAVLGSTPIGSPIVGAVGEAFGPRSSLLLGGIGALAAASFGWLGLSSEPETPDRYRASELVP